MKSYGKAYPLVESFCERLDGDHSLDGPEPDFQKWIEDSLFINLSISSDEVAFGKEPDRTDWRLFHDALEATKELLEFYKEDPESFRKISRQLSFLPSFLSWHPHAEQFNRQLLEFSQLGREGVHGELRDHPHHLVQQPATVRYAYAIMATVDRALDSHADDLFYWPSQYGYGVKHLLSKEEIERAIAKLTCREEMKQKVREANQGAYRFLPVWTQKLINLRRPFKKNHVLDYWSAGKAMILEEMPDFHNRPEWCEYHKRRYAHGAKAGAIQHAIFKDILTALRTIAGANKRKARTARRKSTITK